MYWLKISHSKAKMELSPQRAKLEATGNVNRIRNSEHHSLCVPGPLPSHVFSGGHIWEENGRLQSILTQALEVIYGRKTEDFDPFSLKRWRSYMGGKQRTSIHSHSSAGGHIWEETEDFDPFSLKRYSLYLTLLRSHHPTNFFQQTVKVRPRKILGRKKFPLLQIWIFPTDLCRFL